MRKFIRIVDGQPHQHPVLESNMRVALPYIDLDNLPDDWAEFVRIPMPEIGPYEIYQGVDYQWVDGKVQDVHLVREMIESERQEKIEFVKNQWTSGGGYASWTFNETECRFDPPVPYPKGDEIFVWDEPALSWKAIETQTIEGQ